VTPPTGRDGATVPDLGNQVAAATAATGTTALACAVAAGGSRRPGRALRTPWVLTNGRPQEHRYQTCRDESCERFACRVWREGFREGYERGYGAGHAAGEAVGYAKGHGDGYGEGYAAGAASGSG
jgi:hypothetical protein